MRTVDMREVVVAEPPVKSKTHVEAIVGQTLGEVSVEELINASHSVKATPDSGVDPVMPAMHEVYLESEEE